MSEEQRAVRDLLMGEEELDAEVVDELRRRALLDGHAHRELRALVRELPELIKAKRSPETVARLSFAQGLALSILGRSREAAEVLGGLKKRGDVKYYLGDCLAKTGRWQEAQEALRAVPKGSDRSLAARLLLAEVLAKLGETEEAQAALEELPAESHDSPAYWAARGFVAELCGEVLVAREMYHRALELDPDHAETLFRLAYSLDLSGEDEQAIELYERCASLRPTYINALVNLGVLYEDRGEPKKAIACYRRVLGAAPAHPRASLFLKDAEATLNEVVDEVELKRQEQMQRVLNTPITDFELSVRSQKCLEQMDISTLGDLTQVTESDLLARKNFGETSLAEIKAVMAQKGLRLGQALEEDTDAGVVAARLQEQAELEDKLSKPLSELELSVRSRRCIEELGLATLGDLIERTEGELLACPNFGQVSLSEVKQKLSGQGLKLKGES